MVDASDNEFLARLARFRRAWQRGLFGALLVRMTGWALVAATAYYAADYFLALTEGVRGWLNILLPLGVVVAAAPAAVRMARLGLRATAERIDTLAQHRRHEVLSAWELLQAHATAAAERVAERALPSYLLQRSVDAATARLVACPPRLLRSQAAVVRHARRLALYLLLALSVIWLLGVEALWIILPRMVWPARDIPPYSAYHFVVSPATPSILYGGTAEVSATLGGAPLQEQVWLMTRKPGQPVRRAACFQEAGQRYAQRLENVTEPLEFCFAVGRARSRWHRVQVQLQPQVVRAEVRLTPPPYTRLAARDFAVGQEDLAGVRGAAVRLVLTSNRPLQDGTLTIASGSAAAAGEQIVAGRRIAERAVAFAWTLQGAATLRATIRDVRGHATAEPLVFHQKLLPDNPPTVVLSDPPEFCLATPSAEIKVAGSVEDDFGVTQVDWVRALVGFNDRGVTLRREGVGTRFDFESALNLGELGVDPGQAVELYIEALDNNPLIPGVGASGVARVKVISEEEYAEMVRNREAIELFMVRYELAMAAMARVQQSLGELQGLVVFGTTDKEGLASMVRKVREVHNAATKVFGQLAHDFAAYDSEKQLQQTASNVVAKLAQNQADLATMHEPGAETSAKAEAMVQRFVPEAQAVQQQQTNAALAMQLARVMDGAARFQAVVRRQELLVRWFKQRYGGKRQAGDLAFLPGYGEHQAEVLQALHDFVTNATAAAVALPPAMLPLQGEVLSFVRAVDGSGASNHMGFAMNACLNSDAARACREAQLALEKLQRLLQEGGSTCSNRFQSMCRGQQPNFGPEDLKKTLQQMFRSLCRKRGVGQGSGVGEGEGGDGDAESGTGGEGYSALGMPVYGPSRSTLGSSARESTGAMGEGRRGSMDGAGRRPAVVEHLPGAQAVVSPGEAVPVERLPARYRDAVKRYFQDGEKGVGP